MKKLLHIIATPRGEDSRTLRVSEVFLEEIKGRYPDCNIEELNVFKEGLPEITLKMVDGKYILLTGGELSSVLKNAWKKIEQQINRFLSADAYLITTPMWNFSIPYRLKHYIDIIIQPKYLFQYTEKGPQGLVKNKKMVVITSRGGDYTGEAKPFDFQEPYLRTIFGFIGISEITFINTQPMDALGEDIQKQKIEEAKQL
ncbi:MAG: NAD(P)H-dependent oxidoreductase, partial [Candidatus Omnitrophica bacterium]|nr:NAD(P)H-dependent oxidoreductase [Candidatus Omnitrophota bacterium]